MKNEELNIITRILSGKTDEFTYFLDTYGQQVYSLIVRIVRSEADAEELTQDTFMKCFENLSSFNAKSSFSTWLYRIAYNTAVSFTRKKEPEVKRNTEIKIEKTEPKKKELKVPPSVEKSRAEEKMMIQQDNKTVKNEEFGTTYSSTPSEMTDDGFASF